MVRQARERIAGQLPPTPLLPARALSRQLGVPIRYKAESLQPTGAFKVRPAYNSIAANLEQARRHAVGVVRRNSGKDPPKGCDKLAVKQARHCTATEKQVE